MTTARPACQGHDGDLWFPVSYETTDGLRQAAQAVAICQRCPVQTACLLDAMADEGGKKIEARYGIRGGYTPTERFNGRRAETRSKARARAAA